MTGFADHFSRSAPAYAAYRPSYPAPLISYISSLCAARDLAWDAGTGSGQAAVRLAAHFTAVVATDASADQIGHAQPHPTVTYRIAPEDQSGLASRSADLVTVAQALHWFDLPRFYREVRRVLKPGGVLAAWCYGRVRVDAAVDPIIDDFYARRLAPFWPPERRHVEAAYGDLPFPFDEIRPKPWVMKAPLTRPAFLGYLGTWSAVARARESDGSDPLAELARQLADAWRDEDEPRIVTWPIGLRVGTR